MSVAKTVRDISELTVNAQKACNLFLEECKRQGLNVLITETYRSQERQNYLYEQGRTRPGNKVTWTKSSRHTSRRAWDICKNVKGGEYSDSAFFKKCGEIAKKYGITWGGTWKTPDTPHFEISEDWEYKEVNEMTNEEKKEFEALKEKVRKLENPMIYNYVDENMPVWAREAVQYFMDAGVLRGTGDGLGLSDSKLWFLTILYRALIKNN